MADSSWEIKDYPEEAKTKLDQLIESTVTARKELDLLDSEVRSYEGNPTAEIILGWARRSSGFGNQLRKIYRKLEASLRNTEAMRYIEIKIECDSKDLKFTDGAAKMDAQRYCRYLRTARSIIESYVESSDSIISICRMHSGQQFLDQSNDISA